jgi:acetyltransferase-like isoleucine patch superfamily enzyme
MDVQKELHRAGESKVDKYRRLVVGKPGLAGLIKYELIGLVSAWIPGAFGLFLRSHLYPRLLSRCGQNVAFGTNVVLRHPHKVAMGQNIVLDDNCVIDAKGEKNAGIVIGSNVFVGRNTIIYCQNGKIVIGENANIGSNCQIFSAGSVEIGKNVLVGAYSYLIGGGHVMVDPSSPIIEQGRISRGIRLGDNVWVGAAVKILDGVTIGRDAVIGTGAVVTRDVGPFVIAGGVPAEFIKDRRDHKADGK